MTPEIESLLLEFKKKDRRAFSRLLSLVELQNETSFEILSALWQSQREPLTVGFTGPAGAGKSTLIDQSISFLRGQNKKVGVVAVDPTSPYTGGAVLGDRIRMQKHSGDEQVFIRSVGSRGKTGGVSFSTRALLQLFRSYGAQELLLETVGVGQSETSVAHLVDTTVVVLVPEAGDAIQALKAGLLEIADVYVVNKKDRSGADNIVGDIQSLISMNDDKQWMPPIVQTQAQSGEGVAELWQAIHQHRIFLRSNFKSQDELQEERSRELKELVEVRLSAKIEKCIETHELVQKSLSEPQCPNLYALAQTIVSTF